MSAEEAPADIAAPAAEVVERHVEWMRAQPDHLRPSDAFIDGFSEAAVLLRDRETS